jgi:hypothetical protein
MHGLQHQKKAKWNQKKAKPNQNAHTHTIMFAVPRCDAMMMGRVVVRVAMLTAAMEAHLRVR